MIELVSKSMEVYPLARKDTAMITLYKAILNTDTEKLPISGAVAYTFKSITVASLVMCLLM